MLKRNCVCGKPIPHNQQLCASCLSYYGVNAGGWPLWLTEWLKNYQAELDSERNHQHLAIEVDGTIRKPARPFKLNGCRTETHLYEDRENH